MLKDEPMGRHTTFRIGGPAKLFVMPEDTESLCEIVQFCIGRQAPLFVLGNGSNLLVSDRGIDGIVLSLTGLRGIRLSGDRMECLAGEPLVNICHFARDNSLTGLEFAYGIPGTVGGAVFMNAGAYGGEMKDITTSVKHVDSSGIGQVSGGRLDFGYRSSAYSAGGKVIISAELELRKGDPAEIAKKMDELMNRRKLKQPLEYPSAGSVFKRPAGHYAGTLIEGCGLKGLRVGGAVVSEKHAGFIVNDGGATCHDVLALIEKIKNEVFKQTGVELQSEIRLAGRV